MEAEFQYQYINKNRGTLISQANHMAKQEWRIHTLDKTWALTERKIEIKEG